MTADVKIIVALDFPDALTALKLVEQLEPAMCKLKVGKELFTRAGPSLVEKLTSKGFDVFLDLKFHDIPNTVASACKAATELGVWMLNVHTLGGRAMLEAAREAIDTSDDKPLLIGVTVLTSMDDAALREVGIEQSAQEQVMQLAKLAQTSGLDGVVCSAQEAQPLRQLMGEHFTLVTPGIRPAGSDKGDQKRIMTPKLAIDSGASYLVIGRPITQAQNPLAVIRQISEEISPIPL
jgi:orotidine-5'-phosphate decarboxylase